MKTVALVARLLLGLVFTVFGLNGFLHFIPNMPMPDPATAFLAAMGATGYMLPLLFATQVVGGVLLLAGRFVPLALALLAPVLVNIMLFHLFLAPGGIPVAIIVVVLELFLAWTQRAAFAPMLRA
jgi:uncharacterized membrane protein YphA (DoxX/SURF4 family)